LPQPKLFENVVRFVEMLFVEALEIAKVVGVEGFALEGLDHFGDARALFAHGGTIRRGAVRG
jgi:hypothetical protein